MSDATLHQHLHQPSKRHTLQPHFVNNTEDPTLSQRPRAFTPGTIAITAFAASYWLYATGKMPFLDHLFDRVYWLSLQHNDEIVSAILGWFPAMLGLAFAGLLTVTVLLRLNNRRRRQALARARRIATELCTELAPAPPESLPLPSTKVIAINDPLVRQLRPIRHSSRGRKVMLPTG